MKKNEIIIVEGKTDQEKLEKIFGNKNVNIIKTNGFNLNKEKLDIIKSLSIENNIIVFTDPDWAGNKIRKKINDYLENNCFNAFINKEDIKNLNKKGIAEADEKDIIKALNKVTKFDFNKNAISWKEYLKYDLFIKKNRIKISVFFGWPKNISNKNLYKYIKLSNTPLKKLLEIIE